MYKKLVRPLLTLTFGALMVISLSVAMSSGSAFADAAEKGTEYTNPSGGHVCICEGGTACQPCGHLTLE